MQGEIEFRCDMKSAMKNATKAGALAAAEFIQNGAINKAAVHQAVQNMQRLPTVSIVAKSEKMQRLRAWLWGNTWKWRIFVFSFIGVGTQVAVFVFRYRNDICQSLQESRLDRRKKKYRATIMSRMKNSVDRDDIIANIKQLNDPSIISFEEMRERKKIIYINGQALDKYDTSSLRCYSSAHISIEQYREKYSAQVNFGCIFRSDSYDMLEALLPKMNWLNSISLRLSRFVFEKNEARMMQLTRELLRNNKNTLQELHIKTCFAKYDSGYSRKMLESEAQCVAKQLEICLDFCTRDANVKQFKRLEYPDHLLDGYFKYSSDWRLIVEKTFVFARHTIINGIEGMPHFRMLTRLLILADIINAEEAHKKGVKIKDSYLYQLCKLRSCVAMNKKVATTMSRLKLKYGKAYRKEILWEMIGVCYKVPKFYPFDQSLLYCAEVYQRDDGLRIYENKENRAVLNMKCVNKNFTASSKDFVIERYFKAFAQCKGVKEVYIDDWNYTIEDDILKKALRDFVNNNRESLQKLEFPYGHCMALFLANSKLSNGEVLARAYGL